MRASLSTHPFALILGILNVMTSALAAQPAVGADDKAATELVAADRAMQRAVVDRDPVTFGRFLTEDYVLVDSKGRLHDKASVVAAITAPEPRVSVNASKDLDVRVHGDTGMVIAILEQRGTDQGRPYEIPVRFTDTWIRRDGRWLCLSGHASLLQSPEALPTQDDVKKFAKAFDHAQLVGDRASLARMIADDLVYVRGSGTLTGKREFISAFTARGFHLEPFEIVNPTYLQLGPDAAIVGGESTLRGTEDGRPFAQHLRYADTFQRRNGNWRAVHVQVTTIP